MIGEEHKVKFWNDRLYGDFFFNLAFPSIFSISHDREDWEGMYGVLEQGRGCWTTTWIADTGGVHGQKISDNQ